MHPEQLIDSVSVKPPEFQFWQPVRLVFQSEGGFWEAKGIITGILFEPPEYRVPGWVYQVKLHRTGVAYLKAPHTELFHETDLSLDLQD